MLIYHYILINRLAITTVIDNHFNRTFQMGRHVAAQTKIYKFRAMFENLLTQIFEDNFYCLNSDNFSRTVLMLLSRIFRHLQFLQLNLFFLFMFSTLKNELSRKNQGPSA